jgi:hypothetical protein
VDKCSQSRVVRRKAAVLTRPATGETLVSATAVDAVIEEWIGKTPHRHPLS